MPFINTNFNDDKFTILLFNYKPQDIRNDGIIKDLTLNNNRYIIVKKIDGNLMDVNLTYIHGVRDNRPFGFTLPRHFTLTKE